MWVGGKAMHGHCNNALVYVTQLHSAQQLNVILRSWRSPSTS